MLNIQESWVARGKWIIPESHASRAIGMSTDKEYDKNHYAEVYAIVHEDRHGRHTESEVTARMLACVNACAGIPTELLEKDLISPDKAIVIKEQRDELLAALKDMIDYFQYTDESEGQYESVQRAKAVIAKCES